MFSPQHSTLVQNWRTEGNRPWREACHPASPGVKTIIPCHQWWWCHPASPGVQQSSFVINHSLTCLDEISEMGSWSASDWSCLDAETLLYWSPLLWCKECAHPEFTVVDGVVLILVSGRQHRFNLNAVWRELTEFRGESDRCLNTHGEGKWKSWSIVYLIWGMPLYTNIASSLFEPY